MALRVRLEHTARPVDIPDSEGFVEFGRDAGHCHVVLPADRLEAGGRHCALRAELGGYRFVLQGDHPVFVAGRPARDGEELPPAVDVQFGVGGPSAYIEVIGVSGLAPTLPRRLTEPGTRTILARVQAQLVRYRLLSVLTIVVATALAVVGWWAWPSDDHRLVAAAVEKAIPSVYLVAKRRGAAGDGDPLATAWVVGPGLLATNAHVAREFSDAASGTCDRDGRMVVISNEDPPREVAVVAAEAHPGYEVFRTVWEECGPEQRTVQGIAVPLKHVGACDVALLRVEAGARLGAPLPLADAGETVRPGQRIGLVGYPLFGVKSDRQQLVHPSPETDIKTVSSLTGDLLVPAGDGSWTIMHHRLETSMGASGSPILERGGRVVAVHSTGNYEVGPDGALVQAGSGLAYAQHVKLLRELLDGTAGARLAERTEGWRKALHGGTAWRCARAALPLDRSLALRRDNFIAAWLDGDGSSATVVSSRHALVAEAGFFRTRVAVRLERPGEYFVMALAADGRTKLSLEVMEAATSATLAAAGDDWSPWERLLVDRPLDVVVAVTSAAAVETVAVEVRRRDAASDGR